MHLGVSSRLATSRMKATRMRRRISLRSVLVAITLLIGAHAVAQNAPPNGPEAMQFIASLPANQRLAVLEREAKREGGFTIYGALGIDRAQILNKLFNERYPDVKVNFVRLTEAELADKVLLESRTGRVNSDLALSTVAWMGLLAPALATCAAAVAAAGRSSASEAAAGSAHIANSATRKQSSS